MEGGQAKKIVVRSQRAMKRETRLNIDSRKKREEGLERGRWGGLEFLAKIHQKPTKEKKRKREMEAKGEKEGCKGMKREEERCKCRDAKGGKERECPRACLGRSSRGMDPPAFQRLSYRSTAFSVEF